MSAVSNPAKLLHGVLERANQTPTALANGAVRGVWGETFEFGNEIELAGLVSRIPTLAAETRDAIAERHPSQARSVEAQVGKIQTAIWVRSDTAWSNYWSEIGGDSCLYVLDMAAGLLATSDPVDLTITDVDALRARVLELLGDLAKSDLDPGLIVEATAYLARLLTFLERAQVSPTSQVVEIAQAAYGYLFGDAEKVVRMVKHPVGKLVVGFALGMGSLVGLRSLPLAASETPSPDPVVTLNVESKCVQVLELGQGPKALSAGEAEPVDDAGPASEGP
jgi:hypothetical protein